MKGLFDKFPREIASMGSKTRFIVSSLDEMLEEVNKRNGYCDIFTSEYAFKEIRRVGKSSKGVYETAIVDKIFIDLDGSSANKTKDPLRAYADCVKLHRFFSKKDILHTVFFSGNCYQLHVFIENNLKNPQGAIRTYLDMLETSQHTLIDKKTRGSLAQLVRVPGTLNTKGRRFCISIKNFLKKSHEEILREAKVQSSRVFFYGSGLLDISRFDSEPLFKERVDFDGWPDETSIKIKSILGKLDIPPCIQRLMSIKDLGYEGRFLVIVFLKESGVPPKVTERVLKSFLSRRKFYHCTREEAVSHGGMVNYIYNRGSDLGYYMWSCEKMRQNDYCVKGCKKKHPVYR